MDIKPKYNSETIKFNVPQNINLRESKVVKDPTGQIPNGIYRVIKWEKVRQNIAWIMSTIILISIAILTIIYALILKSKWPAYIIPILVSLFAFYKLAFSLVEKKWLKNAVDKYIQDRKIGLTSTPPFVAKLYLSFQKNQIKHNWITFFLLFNGGILTILLWFLKDFHWWIFEFDKWISALFNNPTMMSWIFTISLITIALVHIVFTIQRKRRILEIDAYFGSSIIPIQDIEFMKTEKNKAYRRLFLIYIITIFIVPLVIKTILRTIRRKK